MAATPGQSARVRSDRVKHRDEAVLDGGCITAIDGWIIGQGEVALHEHGITAPTCEAGERFC